MATKCTVIGEENQSKKLKPIEFVYTDVGKITGERIKSVTKPYHWANIELISMSSDKEVFFDVMFAYDSVRSAGRIYFGWWNDGFVE